MIDQISFMHHWIFCLLLERDKQWAGDDQQSLDQNDTLLAVNMTCQHTHKAVKEQLVVCQDTYNISQVTGMSPSQKSVDCTHYFCFSSFI